MGSQVYMLHVLRYLPIKLSVEGQEENSTIVVLFLANNSKVLKDMRIGMQMMDNKKNIFRIFQLIFVFLLDLVIFVLASRPW